MYCKAFSLNGSWDTYYIGAIPAKFKPKRQLRQKVCISNYGSSNSLAFWVNSGGSMYLANFGDNGFSGSSEASMTCCWAVS